MNKSLKKYEERYTGDYSLLSMVQKNKFNTLVLVYDNSSPIFRLWFDKLLNPEKFKEIESILGNKDIK